MGPMPTGQAIGESRGQVFRAQSRPLQTSAHRGLALRWSQHPENRGIGRLAASAVQIGVMDGLPGLAEAFLEAFPQARVCRCWVHKLRNVMPLVARRYQAEFKVDWNTVAYASDRSAAQAAFTAMKERWQGNAKDAMARFEKDLPAFLCHYDFPQEYWAGLRTTNPIERVNKEFKRRSKSTEKMSADGLKALLAFTALRLEFGWASTPVTSPKLANLLLSPSRQLHHENAIGQVIDRLLH